MKNHKKHEFKIPLCLQTNLVQKPQPKMVCVNFWRHPVKQPRRRSNFRVQWPLALLNQGPLKKWTEHSNCPLRGRVPSMYYVIKILGFLTPSPLPFVITFSTECNQKLSFSDPPSPLLWLRNTWMVPRGKSKTPTYTFTAETQIFFENKTVKIVSYAYKKLWAWPNLIFVILVENSVNSDLCLFRALLEWAKICNSSKNVYVCSA